MTVRDLFKIKDSTGRDDTRGLSSQTRYLVEMSFWRLLCKKLNIYNKPLVISFNHLSPDNKIVKAFLNNSRVIDEEDSFEEDSQLIEDIKALNYVRHLM